MVILHMLWDLGPVGHAAGLIRSVCVRMCGYWGRDEVVNPCVIELESEKWREKKGEKGEAFNSVCPGCLEQRRE